MKKIIITLLIILLAITANLAIVTANNETETNDTENKENESLCFSEEEIEENIENESKRKGNIVKTPTGGSRNISFEDGYNGYCINKGWNGADSGDEFKVVDTSYAKHNKGAREDVSNYIKILFTHHHDFAIKNKDDTANIIWTFSDWDYKTTDNELVRDIVNIAKSGVIIPDHGFIKQINETTEALFNFEVLKATQDWHQSFFGYKITYRTIPVESVNNTSDNNLANRIPNKIQNNKPTETPNIKVENRKNNSESLNMTLEMTKIHDYSNQTNDTTNKTDMQKLNTTPQNNKTNNLILNLNKNETLKPLNDIREKNHFDNKNESSNVLKHATGYSLIIALLAILLITSIVIIRHRRD